MKRVMVRMAGETDDHTPYLFIAYEWKILSGGFQKAHAF